MERDGERFKFVLDYLRDGCAHIPITFSKASLLADFEYYGIANVDETKIDCNLSIASAITVAVRHEISSWCEEKKALQKKSECIALARFCAKKYFFGNDCTSFEVDESDSKAVNGVGLVSPGDLEMCNLYLGKVGLLAVCEPQKNFRYKISLKQTNV